MALTATLRSEQTAATAVMRGPSGLQPMRVAQRSAVAYVADVSGSMRGVREERQRSALAKFAAEKARLDPHGTIAIIAFSHTTRVLLPFTPASELQTVMNAIEQLGAEGSTDITDALLAAHGVFAARPEILEQPSSVALGTDGHDRAGGAMVAAAEAIKKLGVELYTFGIVANSPDDVDPRLPSLASAPENHFYCEDEETLVKAFRVFSKRTTTLR